MKITATTAPSRIGKKQVIAYLDDSLVEKVHSYSHLNKKTIQHIMAEAINIYLYQTSGITILKIGPSRVLKRKQRVSRKRGSESGHREGKRALIGWYESNQVNRLLDYAKSQKTTIQKIIEEGLRIMIFLNNDGFDK